MATQPTAAKINGSFKKILSTKELQEFDKMSKEIMQKIAEFNKKQMIEDLDNETEADEALEAVKEWVEKVLKYNLLGGKMLRGLMVPMTYKSLMKEKVTKEDMRLAYALGWVLELMQAASLVADDIMDHSETRRGKLCWYKQPHVGLTAVNDSSVLEMASFMVLRIYFEHLPYYRELYDTISSIMFYTIFGQSLDTHTEQSNENILECYTKERYDTIVRYKTSYYTTYMPVICGLIMTGKSQHFGLVHQVESIMLQIGHYFQVQDDYLDCFGNVEKTGKGGTDIQDNKCTWLFVQAVQLAKPQDKELLIQNYGKFDTDNVEKVKQLYERLGLEKVYQKYEDDTYQEILKKIGNLPEEMPSQIFHELLAKLYKRKV